MRILDYRFETDQPIDRYGSTGAAFGRIAGLGGAGQVGCIHLEPGGALGRHPAPIPQMFCVIDGEGQVSGTDGIFHTIEAGQAACWDAGESHESSTETGMTIIVIELTSIQAAGGRS
jgi:mannose-6-phosphate isomerase-like protein (cupin superfamily)